jgi:hypothetical protein
MIHPGEVAYIAKMLDIFDKVLPDLAGYTVALVQGKLKYSFSPIGVIETLPELLRFKSVRDGITESFARGYTHDQPRLRRLLAEEVPGGIVE